MRQKSHSARVLVVALTTLLMGSLAGAPGLVLCLGVDGHRAIELEHDGTACPMLAGSSRATAISAEAPAVCFDVPAAGTGPTTLSSVDAQQGIVAPAALLAVRLDPVPGSEARLPASVDAHASPPKLALHLTSTVLLV